MAQKITAIKGMHDILPPDVALWHRLEDTARRVFAAYGYDEIRTPIVERTELFTRSIGTETDVVSKEMYTFDDGGGDKKTSLTLRPEGTAGVVRAYVEHGVHVSAPQSRFWYLGPMFRREQPQKGRQRQFWQIGAEMFGQGSPRSDAEMLVLLADFFDAAGVRDVVLEMSSLGDDKCRPAYRAELQAFLREPRVFEELCGDCKRRVETNPLRVLDCKKDGCKAATAGAPMLLSRLCDPCKTHFAEVRRNLDASRVDYQVNSRIVRGLDYYVRTAFELVHKPGMKTGSFRVPLPGTEGEPQEEALGSQKAVGGGGRYDGLVKELGGGPIAGIGFGLGVERMVMVLQAQKTAPATPGLVWIAALGPEPQDEAMLLARQLRARDVRVELGFDAKLKELKQEITEAKKRNAKAVVILGPDELAKRVVQVKDLRADTQIERKLDANDIAEALARIT